MPHRLAVAAALVAASLTGSLAVASPTPPKPLTKAQLEAASKTSTANITYRQYVDGITVKLGRPAMSTDEYHSYWYAFEGKVCWSFMVAATENADAVSALTLTPNVDPAKCSGTSS
jgi:hypothetical protein